MTDSWPVGQLAEIDWDYRGQVGGTDHARMHRDGEWHLLANDWTVMPHYVTAVRPLRLVAQDAVVLSPQRDDQLLRDLQPRLDESDAEWVVDMVWGNSAAVEGAQPAEERQSGACDDFDSNGFLANDCQNCHYDRREHEGEDEGLRELARERLAKVEEPVPEVLGGSGDAGTYDEQGGDKPTIYDEIRAERERAHAKHGDTSMESAPVDAMFRAVVLGEEIGEMAEVIWSAAMTGVFSYVAKTMNDGRHDGSTDMAKLRRELVQIATMAAAWADRIPAAQGMEPRDGESAADWVRRAADGLSAPVTPVVAVEGGSGAHGEQETSPFEQNGDASLTRDEIVGRLWANRQLVDKRTKERDEARIQVSIVAAERDAALADLARYKAAVEEVRSLLGAQLSVGRVVTLSMRANMFAALSSALGEGK